MENQSATGEHNESTREHLEYLTELQDSMQTVNTAKEGYPNQKDPKFEGMNNVYFSEIDDGQLLMYDDDGKVDLDNDSHLEIKKSLLFTPKDGDQKKYSLTEKGWYVDGTPASDEDIDKIIELQNSVYEKTLE